MTETTEPEKMPLTFMEIAEEKRDEVWCPYDAAVWAVKISEGRSSGSGRGATQAERACEELFAIRV